MRGHCYSNSTIRNRLIAMAGVASYAEAETLGPLTMRGRERSYILFPRFYAPRGSIHHGWIASLLCSLHSTSTGRKPISAR
jgi:hypothetical protein